MIEVFEVTPTIGAEAYSAGDAVGGLMEFENVASPFHPSGRIVGAVLIDKANQLAVTRLVLYDRTFTPTASGAEADPTDADLAHAIGVLFFAAADYQSLADNAVASVEVDIPFMLAADGTSLFGQLVTEGTPTYASTSDLIVKLFVES